MALDFVYTNEVVCIVSYTCTYSAISVKRSLERLPLVITYQNHALHSSNNFNFEIYTCMYMLPYFMSHTHLFLILFIIVYIHIYHYRKLFVYTYYVLDFKVCLYIHIYITDIIKNSYNRNHSLHLFL